MKRKIDVVRAWRDEDYYLSLTEDERSALPANPSGAVEISENSLKALAGGGPTGWSAQGTAICSPCYSNGIWYHCL